MLVENKACRLKICLQYAYTTEEMVIKFKAFYFSK